MIALSLAVLAFVLWKNSVALFPEFRWTDPILLWVVTLAGTAFILFSAFYRQTFLPHAIAAMVAMLLIFADWGEFPRFSRYQSVQRFAQRINSMPEKQTLRVAICLELAVWHPDIRFYTGITVEGPTDIQAVHDFVTTPGRAMLVIYEKYLPEVFGNGTVRYKIIDRGPYLKHGLPALNYFLHPISPNTAVLVEVSH